MQQVDNCGCEGGTIVRISKKSYRDWLEQWDEGEVIGIREETDRCPLANYFAQHYAVAWVSVHGDSVEYESSVTGRIYSKKLQEWCNTYVNMIDNQVHAPQIDEDAYEAYEYDDYYDNDIFFVYADEAKKVLEEV